MHYLLLLFYNIVIVRCSNMNSEYYDVDDISDDGSLPESKEVVSQHYSVSKEILSVTDRVTVTTREPNKSEDKYKSTTLINYPFAVSIQRKGSHYATGALLDKKWILSSAGEFYNVRESIKLFRARLGSVDCKKGGTLVPLKKIEIHPSYIPGLPNFDLSLLKLAQPLEYTDYIRPIALSKIRTKVISAKFMTTYWPKIVINGKALPFNAKERVKQNSMRVSTQRLIPRNRCLVLLYDSLENSTSTLHDSTLCLKPFVIHHSPCLPDAGAPVVAEDGLWGITSGWVAKECSKKPSPTLFSRVSSLFVRTWLDSLIVGSDRM